MILSPLCRTVRFYESDERRSRQGLSGKYSSLQLDTKAIEGVTSEDHLTGLNVNDLTTWTH